MDQTWAYVIAHDETQARQVMWSWMYGTPEQRRLMESMDICFKGEADAWALVALHGDSRPGVWRLSLEAVRLKERKTPTTGPDKRVGSVVPEGSHTPQVFGVLVRVDLSVGTVSNEPTATIAWDDGRRTDERYGDLGVTWVYAPSGAEAARETRATKDVFRNLQKDAEDSFEPVGLSFSRDRDSFERQARAYLGDRSDLSARTIDKADWDAVFRYFTVERTD